jgi:hypothetical protein
MHVNVNGLGAAFMNLFRLNIKARIYSGFGLLLAISLILTAFAAQRMADVQTDVGELGGLTNEMIRVIETGRQIEIMRRSVLRYKFDGDQDALKASSAAAARASELMQAAVDTTLADDRRGAYNRLTDEISAYQIKRDALVETNRLISKSRADLFVEGEHMTAAADQLLAIAEASDDSCSPGTGFKPLEGARRELAFSRDTRSSKSCRLQGQCGKGQGSDPKFGGGGTAGRRAEKPCIGEGRALRLWRRVRPIGRKPAQKRCALFR